MRPTFFTILDETFESVCGAFVIDAKREILAALFLLRKKAEKKDKKHLVDKSFNQVVPALKEHFFWRWILF